ncbi:4Fe-4S dicluster domain-containing protein [Limnochorda pilosa]|uniref:4Fe-4S ferredoxin n=1 Tax=Limnochorda pilosa TaxID=1555112 RepID=A0A0K2SIY5_LIMPI|nr:4Fe-4S dicluster domain-containing protein [Limnochorda pilosa]BAS27063.1 4Fe-4S ferredoxin [Limnochorda pilosa]
MDLTRRQLFRWAARLGAAGAAAGWTLERTGAVQASAPARTTVSSQKGMLVDMTLCIGCRSCEWACQTKWGLDGSAPEGGLSPQRWTWVRETQISPLQAARFYRDRKLDARRAFFSQGPAGGTVTAAAGEASGSSKAPAYDLPPLIRYARTQCFHCLDPSCVSACPVAALRKTEQGPVVYDEERCIGCRYCMMACPFQIPRYEWASWNPAITKCLFCYDRLAQGEEPACAAACPTGATQFGDRDRLLEEAKQRIAQNPKRYVPYIYGEEEAGGTAWLFLSDVPFEQLGFRMDVPKSAPPLRTARVMGLVPPVAGGLAVALGALAWWNGRREAEEAPPAPAPRSGRRAGKPRESSARR